MQQKTNWGENVGLAFHVMVGGLMVLVGGLMIAGALGKLACLRMPEAAEVVVQFELSGYLSVQPEAVEVDVQFEHSVYLMIIGVDNWQPECS